MPFKVKEHFRKTKKGLTRVKESTRKDKVKKGLLVAGTALTTLGLGALAYKKLGSKLVKGAVSISSKADDVAASKAKNITKLLTPSKYKTLPDPWLDEAVTVNNPTKALTIGKKETKLLTGSRQQSEVLPDPWEDSIIKGSDKPLIVSKLKEKPVMIPGKGKTTEATRKSEYTIRTSKPETDIVQTDVRVNKKWSESSPRSTGRTWQSTRSGRNNYAIDQKVKSRLNKGEKVSSLFDKRKKKYNTETLVTRVKARNTAIQNQKIFASSLMDAITDRPKSRSRRELLTGGKSAQDLAENFIDSGIKGAINKAGDNVADIIIPGSSQVGRTIRDVKGRVAQVEKLSNELAENGNKKSSRRGFLKQAVNKIAEEGSLKPRDAENVASGVVKKTRVTIRKASSTGTATPEVNYTTDSRFPVQGGVRISKRVYRQPKGLLERMGQRVRKAARYKSGNYDTRYD